jgi:hypothetical protein
LVAKADLANLHPNPDVQASKSLDPVSALPPLNADFANPQIAAWAG